LSYGRFDGKCRRILAQRHPVGPSQSRGLQLT